MADGLTATRAFLAVVLVVVVGSDHIGVAAGALCLAWMTDFLDGRVARAARGETRLGGFDFPVDVSVGVSVLVGLAISGALPVPFVLALLVAFGAGFLLLRNLALGMLLQAAGYGAFLWRLWNHTVYARWLPAVTIAVIALFDRHRLTRIVLPEFFRGVRGVVHLRRDDDFTLSGPG